jgi:hypothetical protein
MNDAIADRRPACAGQRQTHSAMLTHPLRMKSGARPGVSMLACQRHVRHERAQVSDSHAHARSCTRKLARSGPREHGTRRPGKLVSIDAKGAMPTHAAGTSTMSLTAWALLTVTVSLHGQPNATRPAPSVWFPIGGAELFAAESLLRTVGLLA